MSHSFDLSHPQSTRILQRWGHYSAPLLVVSIGASIGLGLRTTPPTALILMLTFTLLLFVLVTWGLMRQHDRRLCESCAAAIPLNPSEQAARYRRRFLVTHASTNPRILVPYLVVLIGSNALLAVPNGRWVWAVVQTSMIYLIVSHAAHRRLQPWCEWCSDGGGGQRDDIDVPDGPRGDRLTV